MFAYHRFVTVCCGRMSIRIYNLYVWVILSNMYNDMKAAWYESSCWILMTRMILCCSPESSWTRGTQTMLVIYYSAAPCWWNQAEAWWQAAASVGDTLTDTANSMETDQWNSKQIKTSSSRHCSGLYSTAHTILHVSMKDASFWNCTLNLALLNFPSPRSYKNTFFIFFYF